jgi:glycosyltransferase involved in cell wall biosynthesis
MTSTEDFRAERTMARPRLMMVTTCLSLTGGAETQVTNMAIGLSRRGWDVEIVTLLPLAPPLPDLRGARVSVTSLEMERGMGSIRGFQRFLSVVRERRPDVVHSHMAHASLLTRVARPFCSMPVLICTLHGHKMYSVKAGGAAMREFAHRLTDGLADVTTAVSAAAGERYARIKAVSRKRLIVIPNGIPNETYTPDPEVRRRERRNLNLRDEFVWLAVGRLEKVKDYDTMLRAFSIALQADVSQVLLIAGGGSLQSHLEALAEELCIAPNVRFLGVCDRVPRLLQAADALVLSSIFEGMPLAMLEAGASGLPVVATRVGGNAEVLPPNQRGLLVPARRPISLGAAMRRLACLSADERRAMGEESRAFVLSRFGMDAILDQWEGLYSRLLVEKGITETVEVSG